MGGFSIQRRKLWSARKQFTEIKLRVLLHARETRKTTPTFALSSVSPGSTATRAFAYTPSRMSALASSYLAVRPRKILSPLATPNMTAILSAAHKIIALPTPHCKLARA